jgi:hypothetical protein
MEEDMGEVDDQAVMHQTASQEGGQASSTTEDTSVLLDGVSSPVLLSEDTSFDLSALSAEEQEAYAKMSPADKDILKAKMAEQALESQRLADELQHQKDKRSQALKDRLAKKKAARLAELQAEGLSEEDAVLKAEAEVEGEEQQEIAKMDEEIAEELKIDQTKKLSEAISLYSDKDKDKDLLKAKMAEQAEESKRLADELQHQKDKRSQALKDRLAKKKGSRVAELQQEEGLSEDDAVLKAELECAVEEEEATKELNDEVAQDMQNAEIEKSKQLDGLCDEEAKRIADEIEAERVTKMAEMNAKLEVERSVQ